jgi:hypothetical protein
MKDVSSNEEKINADQAGNHYKMSQSVHQTSTNKEWFFPKMSLIS